MVNKRESTNVKLVAIINSKNNDQEEEEAIVDHELKAKSRLQRASLYGGGARTKIPKTKKLNKLGSSPFHTSSTEVIAEHLKPPKQLETSIPPGAHNDQFKMVANLTRRSMNDPDRVCYNTSSMVDGLQPIPQPPWYCGYANRIMPAETDMITAAARYGYRGSKNMKQYNTEPYEIPSKTRTIHTPKFLTGGDYINEWVPPIIAGRLQTVNGMETPKLWPENAEFVNGYKNKKLPVSWRYKRETTVDVPTLPAVSQELNETMTSLQQQDQLLQDYVRQESTKSFLSLPMASQRAFDDTWKSSVTKNANNSLKHSLSRDKPVYEAHTLLDTSDVIKYSGTTAVIVHSQTSDELKFRIRMEKSKAKVQTPFLAKWNNVNSTFRLMASKLKRSQHMKTAIHDLAVALEEAAIGAGSATSINRLNFLQTCSKLHSFDGVSQKVLSLLYSQFDPIRKNSARFVELIASLSALDNPEDTPMDKLITLWNITETFGKDRNILDTCLEILCTCARSISDVNRIQELFVQEFRPLCYDMAVNADLKQEGEAEKAAAKKSLSFQPQYNICEHFLNAHTFAAVLRRCPVLVETFDAQLGAALVACHGKDDRYKEPEEEPEPENYDFTWILKKNKSESKPSTASSTFKPPTPLSMSKPGTASSIVSTVN